MTGHPKTVAQEGAPAQGAARVDGNDSHRQPGPAISLDQVIEQGALPDPRGSRHANDLAAAGHPVHLLHRFAAFRVPCLHQGDEAGRRPRIPFEEPPDQFVHLVFPPRNPLYLSMGDDRI
jgi:hypothetical protein